MRRLLWIVETDVMRRQIVETLARVTLLLHIQHPAHAWRWCKLPQYDEMKKGEIFIPKWEANKISIDWINDAKWIGLSSFLHLSVNGHLLRECMIFSILYYTAEPDSIPKGGCSCRLWFWKLRNCVTSKLPFDKDKSIFSLNHDLFKPLTKFRYKVFTYMKSPPTCIGHIYWQFAKMY